MGGRQAAGGVGTGPKRAPRFYSNAAARPHAPGKQATPRVCPPAATTGAGGSASCCAGWPVGVEGRTQDRKQGACSVWAQGTASTVAPSASPALVPTRVPHRGDCRKGGQAAWRAPWPPGRWGGAQRWRRAAPSATGAHHTHRLALVVGRAKARGAVEEAQGPQDALGGWRAHAHARRQHGKPPADRHSSPTLGGRTSSNDSNSKLRKMRMLLRRAIAHTVAVLEGRKGGAEAASVTWRRGRRRSQ